MAPKKNYTPEQMGRAIDAVKKGVAVGVAALKYGVPRITLRNKVTGKSPAVCPMGPATILTAREEQILVQWLFALADRHFPISREQLLDSVQQIIINSNRNTPFTNNRPGKTWYKAFLKRHPEIAQRTTQNLTTSRDNVTEQQIKSWFTEIEDYLEKKNLMHLLQDPTRIFNADESSFFLSPKSGRVLVRRGEKNVYTTSGNEKENLTVLVTANAAGQLAPPMIVFAYERIPKNISDSIDDTWGIGRSESGWMCSSTFYEYFTNIFHPWLIKNKVQLPILFFLDGHGSHLTTHLSDFCASNGIEVVALYPNSTHLLQPMDVAVFRPLKVFWKKQVTKWKTEHQAQQVTKATFAPILKKALNDITKECISNGFRASGIFPFGPEYIDFTKLNSKNRLAEVHTEAQAVSAQSLTFFQMLESEIVKIFTDQKLDLFKKCFFLARSGLEDQLPTEDIGLYTLWAKYKHICHIEFPAESRTEDTEQQNITHRHSRKQTASKSTCSTTNLVSNITVDELPPCSGIVEVLEPIELPNDLPTHFELKISEQRLTPADSIPPAPVESEVKNQLESTISTNPIINAISAAPDADLLDPKTFYSQISQVGPSTSYTVVKNITPDAFMMESGQLESTTSIDLIKTAISAAPGADLLGSKPFDTLACTDKNDTISNTFNMEAEQLMSTSIEPMKNATPNAPDTDFIGSKPFILHPNDLISQAGPSTSTTLTYPATQYCTLISQAGPSTSITLTDPATQYGTLISQAEPSTSLTFTNPATQYCTPVKNTLNKVLGMEVPSPFKRSLFWPEIENKKTNTKKREKLPSAVTSKEWKQYHEKKEAEKRRLQEEKENRIKARIEKRVLKEKIAEEKKIRKVKKLQRHSSSDDTDLEIEYAESGDSEWNEDDDSIEDNMGHQKYFTSVKRTQKVTSYRAQPEKRIRRHPSLDQNSSGSDLENVPLSKFSASRSKVSVRELKRGCYVIIRYEGQHFPGIIVNKDKNLFEISTMTLSNGNTFRWPERQDKIWYKLTDIVERINDPIQQNKRGYFKIVEMEKYLPDIYLT